jgi:hypothetical protein
MCLDLCTNDYLYAPRVRYCCPVQVPTPTYCNRVIPGSNFCDFVCNFSLHRPVRTIRSTYPVGRRFNVRPLNPFHRPTRTITSYTFRR